MTFHETLEVHRGLCEGGCTRGCYCPRTPEPKQSNDKGEANEATASVVYTEDQ